MIAGKKNGFTIVEIVTVVAILGILATIATLTYAAVQKQARDDERSASAKVVAESLEKYFNRHGEYPTVPKVTDPNASTVKQTLGIQNIESLVGSKAGSSLVNLWKTGDASATNKLTYSPRTTPQNTCMTGTASTDACADYRIQFYKEKTGTVETIYSRNTAVVGQAPSAAPATST